jgi:hypothetical protein
MNEGRVYFSLCVYKDKILAMGGYDGEKVLNSCEALM